jgi:hypothetical protein
LTLVASFTTVAIVGEGLLALAINAASSDTSYPYHLDIIKRHPWTSASLLLLIILAAALVLTWIQERSTNERRGGGAHVQRTATGSYFEIHGGDIEINASSQPRPATPFASSNEVEESGRLIRVGDVPMAAASFQSRPDLAAKLEAAASGRLAALVALPGQRGAGKTQLAAAMARLRMDQRWPLVAWINAETDAGLKAGIEEIAGELGIRHEGESFAKAARRVRHFLEVGGERCLLVFDNAESPASLRGSLPRSGSTQIVITTTHREFARFANSTVVDVGGFTPSESVSYLRARTDLDDTTGAAELARELGYLPLGLAQASWVISSQGITYQEYLSKLHHQPIDEVLLRDAADEYRLTVVQAIAIALDDLDRRSQTAARRLLEILSLLSADGVPRKYLDDLPGAGFSRPLDVEPTLPSKPHALAKEDMIKFPALRTKYDVADAVGTLADASLLLFSQDRNRVIVHRLVARVVRFISRPWRNELANRARTMLSRPGETGKFSERAWRHWIDPTDMLPESAMSEQWKSLVDGLRQGGMQVEWAQVNDLVAQYNALLTNVDDETWAWRANASEWIRQFGLESAVSRAEARVSELAETVGSKVLITAYARVHLAYAYWAAGRIDESIGEFEKALPAFKGVHGRFHTRTQMIVKSIAIAENERRTNRVKNWRTRLIQRSGRIRRSIRT